MPVILMTTLFYKALILQGEIWCWSLLGLKGLNLWPWVTLIKSSSNWTTCYATLGLSSSIRNRRIFAGVIVYTFTLCYAIYAIFSSKQAILKEISVHQQLRNFWVAKKLMSHTIFVKVRVFQSDFLRKHLVYRAQIFRDNWNCYALSTFRVFILQGNLYVMIFMCTNISCASFLTFTVLIIIITVTQVILGVALLYVLFIYLFIITYL